MTSILQHQLPSISARAMRAMVLLALTLTIGWVSSALAAESTSSCVTCHSDPNLLVTNKKLYDYYRLWEQSVHGQEGVTCSDCHNGNPELPTKKGAHGAQGMAAASQSSPVNYKNVPHTCAQCHEEFYNDFIKSKHYKESMVKEKTRRGPNCVTCHGSVNTTVLNVNTVRSTCELCHNDETRNHPDIPDRAAAVLNKFLSVQRFYNYLANKEDLLQNPGAVSVIDKMKTSIFVDWHTFEIAMIEKRTVELLDIMKEKRNEIRSHLKDSKN
ncbi:MAG: ammonia-forming cytochrome c nitrite reductase subunit c552 [Candidatus Lambdaproteobacteria bacterium]|nr:ammonia-forming cytochrome c nitrite reductase subunit c552 [Candidatus Lambdaproteobacteria bacterium]